MSTKNSELLHRLYSSLQGREPEHLTEVYHEDVLFNDPAFTNLDKQQVVSMWKMFLQKNDQIRITYKVLDTNEDFGTVYWEAKYPFTQTGRHVHNKITSTLHFQDGRIIRHEDSFDLWKWSRMALGPIGYVLGWSPFVQNKIRKQAGDLLINYKE